MDEGRFVISNELWEKIAPMLPGKAGDPGATGHDNRLFIGSCYRWRARTGVTMAIDLPKAFDASSEYGVQAVSADGRKVDVFEMKGGRPAVPRRSLWSAFGR